MSHPARKPRLEHLAVPLETFGWHVDVHGLSLSRGPERSYRIGLFLQPSAGPPGSALQVFITVDDALFLRDALVELVKECLARQENAN